MVNVRTTNTQTVIVKVQTRLASNDRDDPHLERCLVYDKTRKHLFEQPIPPAARIALKGDVKAFFQATLGDGRWIITRRVPAQFW